MSWTCIRAGTTEIDSSCEKPQKGCVKSRYDSHCQSVSDGGRWRCGEISCVLMIRQVETAPSAGGWRAPDWAESLGGGVENRGLSSSDCRLLQITNFVFFISTGATGVLPLCSGPGIHGPLQHVVAPSLPVSAILSIKATKKAQK